MSKPVIVIGNGGHAAVVTGILLDQGAEIIGFTAPKEEVNKFGLPYIGTDLDVINKFSSEDVFIVIGVGMVKAGEVRRNIFQFFVQNKFKFLSVIHDRAIVSAKAELSEGVQVFAGAIIQPFAKVGSNVIINTGSIIEHDCNIHSHCHIASGATLSGNVEVGENTHIGTGATVIQNVQIGYGVTVGAGAVVTRNVGNDVIVVGIPAKEVILHG